MCSIVRFPRPLASIFTEDCLHSAANPHHEREQYRSAKKKKKKKERKKRTSTTVLGVPFPGEMEKLVFGDGNETQNNDEIERMAARVDE